MRAVIVSVNYGDLLAVTLPAWKSVLPPGALGVATSPDDHESIAVARAHGVTELITDAWTRTDPACHLGGPPTFNAALGMDECLGLSGPMRPRPLTNEVIVNINVDCFPFGLFPDESTIDDRTLYGFWRWHCLTPEAFVDFMRRPTVQRRDALFGKRMKNSGGRPVGYFQAWRYREGFRFGSYPTAGKYDTHFCTKWIGQPAHRMAMRHDLWLLHLGPQADWQNWAGRVVPRWEMAS